MTYVFYTVIYLLMETASSHVRELRIKVADSRQGIVLQLGVEGGRGWGSTTPHRKERMQRHVNTRPRTWTDLSNRKLTLVFRQKTTWGGKALRVDGKIILKYVPKK